jgi:RNA polymerase sigma factor (sigma-70 family)
VETTWRLALLNLQSGPANSVGKTTASTADLFGQLYEQYLPKVFQYVSFRVGDRHTAEDLTSTVFEKALTKFRSYDSAKAAFSTWLFSIARNTVIDHYRASGKEQKWMPDSAAAVPTQDPSPEDEAVRAEEIRKLRSCLNLLGETEREIISLKFGSEMTNRQIAGVLGVSESNVGTIIYRAVRKLRDGFMGWQK